MRTRPLILILTILCIIAIIVQPVAVVRRALAQPEESTAYEDAFQARARQIVEYVACQSESEFTTRAAEPEDNSENLVMRLIGKVAQVNFGSDCQNGITRHQLTDQINDTLRKIEVTSQLGSSGIPCAPFGSVDGEYDTALRGYVWIMYSFPPRADGFGLTADVYRHVRDQLLTVSGTPPHGPGTNQYKYGGYLACGNQEKKTGTPAELVGAYEQGEKACEGLSLDCRPDWGDAGDADEGDVDDDGCFGSVSGFFGCIFTFAVAVVLPTIFPAAAAALFIITAATNPEAAVALFGIGFAIGGPAGGGFLVGLSQWADTSFQVPESENHRLLIETSRFLTNNLKQRDYECQIADLTLRAAACAEDEYQGRSDAFDNQKNGSGLWLLVYLRRFLKQDFIEYNARPYQRYSTHAIENLYNLACVLQDPCTGINLKIKVAAGAVLDYLSAKMAVSSSSLKRFVPYRRLAENKILYPDLERLSTDSEYKGWYDGFMNLFGISADFQTKRFSMLIGQHNMPPCRATDANGLCAETVEFGWGEALNAALSNYRIPPHILPMLAVNPTTLQSGCNEYLQRFRHDGAEVYYCSPSYLIAGGGIKTGASSYAGGLSNTNDRGVALPTTLQPVGVGTRWDEFIRIEGGEDNTPNLCVERNFACGLNVIIPSYYQNSVNFPGCSFTQGNWTLIDGPNCVGRFGFYAAVYTAACVADACGDETATNFGFFEVVEASRLDFNAFGLHVISSNSITPFTVSAENTYVRLDDGIVRFTPGTATIAGQDYHTWPFAEGDVVSGTGDGCILIQNPKLGGDRRPWLLSLIDLENPYVIEIDFDAAVNPLDFCRNRGDYRQSMHTGGH